MASFNRVVLLGNLTRDPQLKYLPNNTAVCEFGLATNHKWRDRDGNNKEEACFVDCACFGRGGEVINQYMTKGAPLLVEGRLRYESWTAQDGSKRSRLSVMVENFQFVGRREGGEGGGSPANRGGYERGAPRERGNYEQAPRSAPQRGEAAPAAAAQEAPPMNADDLPPPSDDIPF